MPYGAAFVLMLMLLGCDQRELQPISPCIASTASKTIYPVVIAKVDVLIVVDNSASMADEQVRLRAQFPDLIHALTTGKGRASDPFYPLQDLHVGVISTDMGLPGTALPELGCRADGGDDGRLQHQGRTPDCQASYPDFLWFVGDTTLGPLTDRVRYLQDVGCIADLGSAGCGYEQPLEAAFKALWPKLQLDENGDMVVPNEYRFLAASEAGTWGRGDRPAAEGGNLGFLRNDRYEGLSAIFILLVTDEDDCSLQSTEGLTSDGAADPSCHQHKERLYDLTRYYDGFRKLRPGLEHAVLVSVIAGQTVCAEPFAERDATDAGPGRRASSPLLMAAASASAR